MSGRQRSAAGEVDPTYPEAFDAPAEDLDAVYDPDAANDAPPAAANDSLDQSAVSPFDRALAGVMDAGEGRYVDEDRDLVVAALAQAEMPSHVTDRELPGLAREWLEGALALRGADEAPVLTLLDRMTREGSRTAARMAKRTLERLAALELAGKAAARRGKP